MSEYVGKLTGKVAIVTGASAGIGEATARQLADAGATVALVARRRDRLEALAKELGDKTSIHTPDLYDPASAGKMIDEVLKAHGKIDIVVMNAGSMLSGPVATAEPENLVKMTNLNFVSPVLTANAVVPAMRKAGHGHLVFVSSLGVRFFTPGNAVYAATKAGVQTFAEILRRELVPDGIRVTTVFPGLVETEIIEHVADATMKKNMENLMASVSALKPEAIADAILYAVTRPEGVSANDIFMRPTSQPN